MQNMRKVKLRIVGLVIVASFALAACAAMDGRQGGDRTSKIPGFRPASEKLPPTAENVGKARQTDATDAAEKRAPWRARTFEEFERTVYREPGPNGKYIVNGDTAFADRKHLKEFFETTIAKESPAPRPGELAVMFQNGKAVVWNATDRKKLDYCVSTAFGNRHANVVKALRDASGAWAKEADVAFAYVAAQDATCTASNPNVTFDVRPVTTGGQFLARAFFPNEPRTARNVLIDDTSFDLDPSEKLSLVGILRHELGHSLGLRHEHTRPESGTCFEDTEWKPLTAYDAFSVMHYPQCNGAGDWSLTLTAEDKSGIACLYGAAPGSQHDTSLCSEPPPPPPTTGTQRTKRFPRERVALDQEKLYPVFRVRGGTRFEATMVGRGATPGDPDLYVRFKQAPDRVMRRFDCRPFLTGAAETCAVDVPADATEVYVMVHGYEAGRYSLTINYEN